jgi:antitoxin HigA-1
MSQEFVVKRDEITRLPTHPGVFFAADILPALGRRTIGGFARLLGVSRQTLHQMMAGETAVSPDMALRLGKLCGNGPELWINMQARHDVREAQQRLSKQIDKIPTLTGV